MKGLGKRIKKMLIFLLLYGFIMNLYAQTIPMLSAASGQSSFFVKNIEIKGNTLLLQKELDGYITHLLERELTLKDLTQAADAIQKAYRDAGYGGVVVFVPEQTMADGLMVIQVVEGKLADIQISGNKRYNEANILRSLPHVRKGETPSVRSIDRNVQMANENPAKDLRVALVAGSQPGEIDADIKVTEERPLRLLFGVDSAGTPGTGNFRTNVGVQHANLWNRDHIGTFQFQTSPTDPSRAQIYSVGYRIPLYKYFSAIDAFYAHSNVESVAAATIANNPLGFTGKGDIAGFRAHRFLRRMGEYDHRMTFGWDWRAFNNNCSFNTLVTGNVSVPVACEGVLSDVTITPLSIGYAGQVAGPKFSWGVNTNFSGNVGGSSDAGFNALRSEAERHYIVWRFFGFGSLALPAGFGLATRMAAQYSPHALVPGEQFGIGGGGSAMGGIISVRGYREREVVGDYGISFNLEGLGPDIAKFAKSESYSLRPLAFFDVGWAGNNHHMPCTVDDTSCTLAGVGGGIRFSIGKRLTGRLDFGHALIDGNQKMAGTTRGHLAVNFSY